MLSRSLRLQPDILGFIKGFSCHAGVGDVAAKGGCFWRELTRVRALPDEKQRVEVNTSGLKQLITPADIQSV